MICDCFHKNHNPGILQIEVIMKENMEEDRDIKTSTNLQTALVHKSDGDTTHVRAGAFCK